MIKLAFIAVFFFSVQYDRSGRISHSYLPYTLASGGKLRKNDQEEHDAFYTSLYGTEHSAYSDVVYDNSPSDRVVEQSSRGPPGSWGMVIQSVWLTGKMSLPTV